MKKSKKEIVGEYPKIIEAEDMFPEMTKWDYIIGFFYRFYSNVFSPITWWRRLRRLYQHITWGFNPKDIWDLDHTLAIWVLPRLKKLKEVKHGCPPIPGFPDECDEETFQKQCDTWDSYLDKMIKAFTYIKYEYKREHSLEDSKKIEEEIQEGLMLFARHYRHLAD
jgi:hypothetical protein